MRKQIEAAVLSTVLLSCMMPVPAAAAESGLLDASAFQVCDENLVYIGADYLNPASVLFNDQDKVPASPDDLKIYANAWDSTDRGHNWKPNWQAEFGDDAMYIDLGANYAVTGICFLDTNGVQDWTLYTGEPYHWEKVTTFATDAYNTWRSLSLEQTLETRYLRFTAPAGDSGICELAIYGYKLSDLTNEQKSHAAPSPAVLRKTDLTAGQRVGFNAFIDDPMTAIFAGGNVREYHNFSWLYDDTGKVKFTQGTWGDMDSYYGKMHELGISVIPCFQGGSTYISGKDKPEIAVPEGADTLDPASYALHAQALYQVAARYGSNKDVDPATLNVAEGSEPKVGMGILNALENSNEPNKTWSGKANYFSPAELAAMCSADYDGHEGTIQNAGVKQADPNFKLAVGGLLTGANLIPYLDEMKLWFSYHRTDGRFAVDILNVHLGPDDYNPDTSGFVSRIQEIRRWIDENAPGTELWISEYEIPMGDCEVEGVDAHDDVHYQAEYARRVSRVNLLAIGAGVDRITKFQLRDESEGVYYNSGLTTGKGEWHKKMAWYDVALLSRKLKNADFVEDRSTDSVKDYVFLDRLTGEEIHAIWKPTIDGTHIEGFTLSTGGYSNAYLTIPASTMDGLTEALTVTDDTVTVDVYEQPNFITLTNAPRIFVDKQYDRILPKAVTSEQNQEALERMFDEPDSVPADIYDSYNAMGEMPLPETAVKASDFEGILALDKPYVLTGFGVYDTFGTGSIEIYDDHTGTLLWSNDLGSYMTWNFEPMQPLPATDRLRIVKGGGDMNELALFGYAAPELSAVQYDVNNDGKFDVLDIVAMQRYLLRDGVKLANANAGDAAEDGVLDVFDLSLMKRALTGGKA